MIDYHIIFTIVYKVLSMMWENSYTLEQKYRILSYVKFIILNLYEKQNSRKNRLEGNIPKYFR